MNTNVNIHNFLNQFNKKYDYLYDCEEKGLYVVGYDEALADFNHFAEINKNFVSDFVKFRGDFISSDREAVAFMFALSAF